MFSLRDRCQKCGEPPAPDAVERYEKQAARRAKRKSKKGKGQKGTSSTASHYTSSGRAHRAAIADEAGEEGGDDDPFTRSNADLEALGAWLECRTCSASIHWGCLNQERRTEILQEWNIEERARHNAITPRDENGKLTRPFFPRRTFEMDEMLDHVDCVICARASQGCMMCKADKSGKRSKARKENDGNGMVSGAKLQPDTDGHRSRRAHTAYLCHYRCWTTPP